jgi:DNA topoisomerase-1
MRVAQDLYESGAITYMRTDGVQMAAEAIHLARVAIESRFGPHNVPGKPRVYETKAKNAQEAHEAIRPTDFDRDRYGSGDAARLYELVWKRATASQMESARLERTSVELVEESGRHALRATGQVVLFPGFLALYEEGTDDEKAEDERRLPKLAERDAPDKRAVNAEQHFTQPPPRYSEASLVKRMEELGIGRPFHLRLDPADAEGPLLCPGREEPPVARGERASADRLPGALLRRYVSYDFTAGPGERAGRSVRRPRRLAGGARRLLARLQARRPPR